MSSLDSLITRVGEGEFQLLTEDRIRDRYETNVRSNPTVSRPLTLEEARMFSEAILEDRNFGVAPSEFSSDEEFFETFERLCGWGMDVYDIEVLFGGELGEYGYIDTVYVVYDDVVGRGMTGQADRQFEKSILEKFGQQLSVYSENNSGLCPFCSSSIELGSIRDEVVIRDESDLIARPHEVDFREYPGHGKTARMWFEE